MSNTSSTGGNTGPSPARIMQVGTGFWASKTLLASIKFGLFTFLAGTEKSAEEIRSNLGLHKRNLYDFLDALVALGFLNRTGLLETAKYSNTQDTEIFLDKNKPSYIGGILEMLNARLYKFWGDLEEGLTTGKPQNESKNTGKDTFELLYADPAKLAQFLHAMSGIQMGAFKALATQFDFSKYKTMTDIGGSAALLSITVAKQHPNMHCTSFDLPPVEPHAKEMIEKNAAGSHVKTMNGDFFKDSFPKSDVITMGNILHDWGTEDKLMLMKKAYDALPTGGALIAIEGFIDDDRRENAFGLLMSLNMLIETPDGYDMTFRDFNELAKQSGFKRFDKMTLAGPSSAAIAYK